MPRPIVVALVLALLPLPALPRMRAPASRIDAARRVLVITAHPDDELLLAPLLADRCLRAGASCAFVVMTSGEHGACALGACVPDLGTVRRNEMARAAAMFGARLTQWAFADVMDDVDATWAAQAGGREVLVRQLADVIAAETPDLILTFDPAHGSTGHPAHRAVGQLVLDTGARNIYLLETLARFDGDGFVLGNASPDASVYVANDDWQFLVDDAVNHASQFTPAQVEHLRALPVEQRRVWFKPAR
ncbi:MAG: PIG-L family deacetylase [Acidobacteria bacterium]|nr:PIG-L family deacetylase [Acidobacteriota bacterium]MBV9474761.1 PIG-L family deacetylase [Acidobacteriota bacterium]